MSSSEEDAWRQYFDTKEDVTLDNGDAFRTYHAGSKGPHIVLLHGGGYSSMTWCLLVPMLKEHFTLHALDFRGHGMTQTSDDQDLSISTLVQDVVDVLARILPESEEGGQKTQTVIAGHSLGGAVAVRVAATEKVSSLVGVMVIDVVEGTAVASLDHMHRILSKRPSVFSSPEQAVHWALQSGTVRNAEAAAVSIPSQLTEGDHHGTYKWRTDLASSAPYWKDWFLGLSEQFLSLKAAKVLVLAGSDRLDTALMRGQMMGKFELRLLYGSGHAIQEDCPDQLAQALVDFCGRCARTVDLASIRIAANGGAAACAGPAVSSANDLLAQRLAKARAMVPPVMPAVMPSSIPKPPPSS
ncbi:hypothetical protein Poli38472_004559 [Pythium oligandrum]|uniref:Protein phosphatase methylesterase 1 n=1 Tax=Pythium oligandrum TaxID=41045 RepID=A0A8K1FDJ5_PYTOL|nr:hypothetical protein Poli38472_004559 [Pythium oligandrum]|eukprot:TMW59490.1 hypothetical protein Poli38472_004559 [Pythium oligandrum]